MRRAVPYLDMVREVKQRVNVPVAIYQVSGEYAMLYHAASAAVFDLRAAVMESLCKRALCTSWGCVQIPVSRCRVRRSGHAPSGC